MISSIYNKLALPPHILPRLLIPLLIISGITCVLALRNNNHNMVELRNELYIADKNGGNVPKALNNLRAYVHGHMNTDLSSGGNAIKPPIQLKYTYERLQAAEQKRVERINEKVYTDAKNLCEARYPVGAGLPVRASCVQEYVTKHGVKANAVPAALYQFDFLSPSWSPDLAGWSLVATIVLLSLLISTLLINRVAYRRTGA
jgi:hypothetical protein